ncbi:hypothetical protein [Tropicimonas sp. S265A]|uniref:hypothetical protein n=1 Tax=Tropicimonas sp. S265A TaxID=3415134 RepID=UPI003C7E53A6
MQIVLRFITFFLCSLLALPVAAEPIRVLFVNGTQDSGVSRNSLRQEMSDWLNSAENDGAFASTFVRFRGRGALASALEAHPQTEVLILDLANTVSQVSQSDIQALQQYYAGGKRVVMMDASFGIRSLRISGTPEVDFPGAENSSGALLANQIKAIHDAGGGTLIGTDHDVWQVPANAAARALLPDARFRGTTNPSTDGQFLGDVLLTGHTSVKPITLLRHWESVPNQGEAPVGNFTDFTGTPVTLYSLVEAADKPGGGRKRPYISASFNPGDARYDIDSELAPEVEPQLPDNMPTRKSPPIQ